MSHKAFATLGSAISSQDLSRIQDTDDLLDFISGLEDEQFLEFFRDLMKLHVTAEFEEGLVCLRKDSELSPDERFHFMEAFTNFDPDRQHFSRLERIKRGIADAERKNATNSGAVSEAASALSMERATALAERDRQAKLAQGRQNELDRQKTELQEKQQRIDRLEVRLAAMERRQIEELTGLWRTLKLATGDVTPPPSPPVRPQPKPAEPALATGLKGLFKGLNEAFREPKAAAPQPREPAPQPSAPPVPPAELLSFLQLAIPTRTDDYLRQLALVATHSNRIATTSRLLGMELEALLDSRSHSPDADRNPWMR